MTRKLTLGGRIAAAAAVAVTALSTALAAPAQANPYQPYDSAVGIFNCSASVIQLPGARDTDKALIMTNGHCILPVFDRYLKRGEVITNYSLWRLNKPFFKEITFHGGSDPNKALASGKLTDVVYATMDDTDLAILRSDKTYAQLKRSGVKIRPFSTTRPNAGTPINIPSTYWNTNYSCAIDGFAHELHEGEWLWRDAIRYTASGCQVRGGSSGSPVIDANTGAIIAVNNTTADHGEACAVNTPCEVDPAGNKRTMQGRGYATQTYKIPTCFNGSNLAMNKAGCSLPKKR